MVKVGVTAVASPGALKIKEVGARRSNCGENRCPIPRFTMVPADVPSSVWILPPPNGVPREVSVGLWC